MAKCAQTEGTEKAKVLSRTVFAEPQRGCCSWSGVREREGIRDGKSEPGTSW